MIAAVLCLVTAGTTMASATPASRSAGAPPTTDAAGRPLGAPQPSAPAVATTPLQALVQGVLPAKARGPAALASLSADVQSRVAAQNGQSVSALSKLLSDDP